MTKSPDTSDLVYQPQHDRHGSIVGFEALLRWKHRQFGFVSPAIVCGLAGESDHIKQIGKWAIDTAGRQIREWKNAGFRNLCVSVNLSPFQLQDPTLLDHVELMLNDNGLTAAEFCFELTESQHVPDDEMSCETLEKLHERGIHLEMDDFGMGYSSMIYIRRFHFDTIKLDGSLTRDVLSDNNSRDIIASVVQLARALDMRVIAEFVESQEQKTLLEQLGCDVFQGYLYSPGIGPEKCLDYLRMHARSI